MKSIFRKKICNKINSITYLLFGITIYSGYFSLNKYRKLKKDWKQFLSQKEKSNLNTLFRVKKFYPYYEDVVDNAGISKGAYFFQDIYVAQRIYLNNPVRHMDVGSRIDGFVAHVASYRKIDVLDIRPLNSDIPNVHFIQCDIMELNDMFVNSTDSISCLHALEHFGLGRYGDKICFEGYLIGFNNITKMLKKNGKFYFSVPMGEQRVEFHGQRVFSMKYLLELIQPHYHIDYFSYVDDKGDFYPRQKLNLESIDDNYKCNYGCAIFELTKL
ncbi:DUF268 domain-containing protein [uncultured Parabacteroides sp.]|uniref:DUF268 domain-containing protein n=1 Tax=uncultured Parabacteroides sp. TaxID=512312 RepID=UPI002598FF91|nr:DUF268 domain-containing protein [uncultured Parabacteroides sp.]